jgi:cysteine desulfurase/selenocysteine lyase
MKSERIRRTVADLRKEIVGIDRSVPLIDGSERPYVYLDNAASTPVFAPVLRCVEEFLPWYSGVHRGTGFKSLLATEVFDAAHDVVGRFVGADPDRDTVVFTKNTTEAVNKLAARHGFGPDDVVITTAMEHHSNDLPWRKHARVLHIGVGADGHIDLAALKETIQDRAGRVRLVAVSGASNITGLCPPIREIAGWAHEAGALIFVDAAQLAPHRPIDMLPWGDRSHVDFVALSAHKMYAPFGTGALIGPKAFFEKGDPDTVGGGVVDIVTLDRAEWNHPPQKEEAGSPNVVGALALAEAISVLGSVGMENVASHEQALLQYAYRKLKAIAGVTLYGPTDDLAEKVGVITFNVDGMHHALAAAILGMEGGIGVRSGCFCAHPYVKELLQVSREEDLVLAAEVRRGDKSRMPGMVRASIGCYNTEADIDMLVDMLGRIVRGEFKGKYVQDRSTGSFFPEGVHFAFEKYFPFLTTYGVPRRRAHSEAS